MPFQLSKWMYPKKVIVCQHCSTRFRVPIKPGKVLDAKCPKCSARYRVAFTNPLKDLLFGKLKWKQLERSDKYKIIMIALTMMLCIGIVSASLQKPVRPSIKASQQGSIDVN